MVVHLLKYLHQDKNPPGQFLNNSFFVKPQLKNILSAYEHNRLIGASLSKPHIDHDICPHALYNAIYIYLSIYHLPLICHILVPEIRVRPEILCLFRYIDMLMYMCILTCSCFTTALD